ncbi:pentapeptide repeat-containing protein [Pengzhenrongella sicca]|uniref:pentapeptide repeat-containing protein n=1 Tax=Pengzhenrongella sicca TaxID=2819238 RepID=UPI001D0CBA6D|nr:pentapeptide repeat-containing protein [Pengzhenrongella sicca]
MTEQPVAAPAAGPPAQELRADCASCFALCCVVPAFTASTDFAITKPAGRPCLHLAGDFRCGIHTRLRERGFRGCTVYDCFGAGQQVSQVTFGGHDWRSAPATARQMFTVFPVMRDLHELLWYLTQALPLAPTGSAHARLRADLERAFAAITALTRGDPADVAAVDVDAQRQAVNPLLVRASAHARAAAGPRLIDHRGADLAGARLRGADLRGASLRGALLIGADLAATDLRLADVTGADLRDACLDGADLSTTLFLRQSQLDAARGDAATVLPPGLARPAHWPAGLT